MEHVSNKEKAKEITKCVWFPQKCTEKDIKNMLMEMAEWKDEQHEQEKQQWIEKALKFLDDNFEYYSGLKIECLLEDFKKGLDYE